MPTAVRNTGVSVIILIIAFASSVRTANAQSAGGGSGSGSNASGSVPIPPLDLHTDDLWAFGHIDFNPGCSEGNYTFDDRDPHEWMATHNGPFEEYHDGRCVPVVASQIHMNFIPVVAPDHPWQGLKGTIPIDDHNATCFSTLQQLESDPSDTNPIYGGGPNGPGRAKRSAGYCLKGDQIQPRVMMSDQPVNSPTIIKGGAFVPDRWVMAGIGYTQIATSQYLICHNFNPVNSVWAWFDQDRHFKDGGPSQNGDVTPYTILLSQGRGSFRSIEHIWDGTWTTESSATEVALFNVSMYKHYYFTPERDSYFLFTSSCSNPPMRYIKWYNTDWHRYWGWEDFRDVKAVRDIYHVKGHNLGHPEHKIGFGTPYEDDQNPYMWDICGGPVPGTPCYGFAPEFPPECPTTDLTPAIISYANPLVIGDQEVVYQGKTYKMHMIQHRGRKYYCAVTAGAMFGRGQLVSKNDIERFGIHAQDFAGFLCKGCSCAGGESLICKQSVNTHSVPTFRWRMPLPGPSDGAFKSWWAPPNGNHRGKFDILPDLDPYGRHQQRAWGKDWGPGGPVNETVGYYIELSYPYLLETHGTAVTAKMALPAGIDSAARQIWVAYDDQVFEACPYTPSNPGQCPLPPEAANDKIKQFTNWIPGCEKPGMCPQDN